jgi:peptidoglycan/LPS O-acetylase OafA/YrhL
LLLFIVKALGWKRSLLLLLGIELAARIFQIPGLHFFHTLSFSPLGFWLSWSIGAFVAHCYINKLVNPLSVFRFDLLLVLTTAMFFLRPVAPFQFMAVSVLTAVAITHLAAGSWTVPSGRIGSLLMAHLGLLGLVSYSFYLVHQPFLMLFQRFSGLVELFASQPLLRLVACLALYVPILFLSYAVYRLVEKPSARIGKLITASR